MSFFRMSNLDSSGRHAHKYNMGEAVKSICSKTGVHRCLDLSLFKLRSMTVKFEDDVDSIQTRLKEAAKCFDLDLTPMQIKSVYSIVRRPETGVEVESVVPERKVTSFASTQGDAGSPVLLDLPTGMGKTITCLLSCLLVTTERRVDIMKDRMVSNSSGCATIIRGVEDGGYVSMVFSPKHVVGQWIREASRAKEIIEKMYEEQDTKWEVVIGLNKKASQLNLQGNQAAVIICDSSTFGPTKAFEDGIGDSCICYDECSESSKSTTNAALSNLDDVFYGRILFCSADFSRLDVAFRSSKESCAMRVALGIQDCSHLGLAVKCDAGNSWQNYMTKRQAIGASKLVATLATASVLPGSYRETVLQDSCDLLGDAHLYTLRLPYEPTLMERLRGNTGSDVNYVSEGATRFMTTFGVNVRGCQTIGDIIEKIQGTEVSVENRMVLPDSSKIAIEKLTRIAEDDCPICLEKEESLCIIQPCLHMVCKTCMSKLKMVCTVCPLCRGRIRGSIGAKAEMSTTSNKKTIESHSPVNNKRKHDEIYLAGESDESDVPTLGDSFFEEMEKNTDVVGISQSLKRVLVNLKKACRSSKLRTLRVMVICSRIDIEEGDFSQGYDVVPYVTKGTKNNPSRRKKLEKTLREFQEDDGRCKLLLCKDSDGSGATGVSWHTKTDDNMTGLDFPMLQAVVSLGDTNRAQRVGRLCRLSRMGMCRRERDAVYVELYKRMND